MLKKLICAVAAIILLISASPAVYADQKSTAVNKEIVFVDGQMDQAYNSSGNIIVDQIIKQNGDSTTTASVYFLYDNDFIYVFGKVEDKTRVSTPPTYDWITDSVEIQLDLDCNPDGQAVGSGYTGLFRVIRYSGSVSVAEANTSPFFLAIKDKVQCVVFDTNEGGYNFEIAIPHLNSFREAKFGASVIINDATDEIANLSAMVFMNNNHTGSYNNTKQFYTFNLNNFSNQRGENAPTYMTSSSPSSTDSSAESEEISSNDGSSYINEPTKLPKNPTSESGENPFILYSIIGITALIVIITVIFALNKNKSDSKDNTNTKKTK